MRTDLTGLWWNDDQPTARGKGAKAERKAIPVPETGWRPPSEFPNLAGASHLSLDVETYDPELLEHGPGWARGKGHIVGVSLGAPGGGKWYFPMRHEVDPEYNMDPDQVTAFLRHTLQDNRVKVGANIIYDLGWLRQEGIHVGGSFIDVQFAEALLNESGEVNLEHLGQKYLEEGKESNLLYRWMADSYGGKADGTASPRLVGPYAESDADLPLRIIPRQYPRLHAEGLLPVFEMENKLIPLLLAMRFRGVRVDRSRADNIREELLMRERVEQAKINQMLGFTFDLNSRSHMKRAFDHLGLKAGKSGTGGESYAKGVLDGIDHPFATSLANMRKLTKLRTTFIESAILESAVDGRVYAQFHNLRGDGEGTRSGRFSSTDPNLQNIPSRDEELAPLIRGLFIPDEGFPSWYKGDYGQIEYRFLVHFAQGQGADDIRQYFRAHPSLDYHELALDMVAPYAGWDISTKELRKHWRKPVKNINFGLAYGMGQAKLADDLGLSRKEGKQLFESYHRALPFVQSTMDWTSSFAEKHGYIQTVLGRRSRFDMWEPTKFDRNTVPLPYEKAKAKWADIRRAGLHKSLNRKLQGSAADLCKAGMVKCWEDGIFNVIGVPQLQVHDELDGSHDGTPQFDEALKEMARVMETAIPLSVPIEFEIDKGPDWGHCH